VLAGHDAKGVRVLCRRSDDLTGVDAGAVLRLAVERLGGKGGGTPQQAQGGAPSGSPEAVLSALRAARA
jgi:hypothetical protein